MTDDLAGRIGRDMPPSVLRAESDTATVDEVVLATGLPPGQASAAGAGGRRGRPGPGCCMRR